ncbi:hypothetical protein [Spirosoma foliorum]|uniref:Uncharacterized protein n=1 Tax=Spirosoma foliorum TaxID=2710596 RepID=A0A7G5GWK6_9BACT|nr:hypothetical protein [Spirosoma foliorum]QMW03248.1 hypothetical protein H3H32_36185 [Spirosoma foliorum]
MHYKLTTTLKKTDTEGRIPAYTLDQYIRGELVQQLIKLVSPRLPVARTDKSAYTNPETVEFTAELTLLKSHQWQQLKQSLLGTIESLPTEQQISVQQLIREIDQN